VYEKGGYYQLDAHRMTPAGAGALRLAFEKLKEKLLKEGLFDEERKRPLPSSVSTLGVITSKNGAALWDIVRVVAKRAPQTNIIIIDTPVQGDKAAARIAESIGAMNEFGGVDLMIVGRGGGSAEDLQAFNDEAVARAVYESRIPIISAVGHEIDFTIADFVADVRARTPSAAAEMAVPDTRERERYFELCAARFAGAFSRYFSDVRERVERVKFSRALRRPITMAQDAAQSLDDAKYRFGNRVKTLISLRNKQVKDAASRLNALSPLATLKRGYSVVLDESGNSIRSSKGLKIGDPLKITFADGAVGAEVRDVS
jgi:exodeoxyribonuclease VII large subunit